ncbi:MAG: CCA tRNA nucleotidyltransferase [Clostridium sp.]|uniref:CCA tRNA nucleotidyltransferase n=1 Tax=Clostridium sp. TaxID=1506 RepID=UPI001D72885C|nr:CCA tRNA nucleotidyltransferase [Clostridium sp.]MBS5926799.1 CCA tRNA nucleotidyltransferase [Clostridium sp.]MBS5986268.1 CCA tRNA nucleotidyltransferase [Clostridium sp.]
MNFNIPSNVKLIIDTFYKNGYEAFMVGGCIRDLLLNKTPTDYDIATSAPPDITQKLFLKTIPTGIKHGTITVIINEIPYEVTTYRTEGKYIDNRHPNEVNFVTNIKEDLSRRDFTVNAFAYNYKAGLLDYFNGLSDLDSKLIKCVGDPNTRFNEDALRMLRAIRFSAQLNFNIDKKTYCSIKNNYKLINNISKERIRDELEKILLCHNPINGLNYLNETKISSLIFSNIGEVIQLNKNLSLLPKDICIRISGLFRNTDPDKVKLLLKDLRFSNNEINKIYLFISNYKYISNTASKIEVKNIIANVGRNNINNLISMYEVLEEKKLDNFKKHSNYIISNNDTLYIKELNINGSILKSNLQLNSGKILGETLNYLLTLVINETINNDTTLLLEEAKKYIKKEVD